ncbi:microfibril-associated glycoprotein 4-like [Styela clava]
MDSAFNPTQYDDTHADGLLQNGVMKQPRRMTIVSVRRKKRTTKDTSFKVLLSITIILFLFLIGLVIITIFLKKNSDGDSGNDPIGREAFISQLPDSDHVCVKTCAQVSEGKIPDTPVGMASSGAMTNLSLGYDEDKANIEVYCDCSTDESWMVFQRRMNGSENFYRNWTDYKNGFGEIDGEFWLGLEVLNNLTSKGGYKLRIDLGTKNESVYAEYDLFLVGNESTMYSLSVEGYRGNAGDSFSYHNGAPFSTAYPELDIPNHACARYFRGGWWYYDCYHAHLNGPWFPDGAVVSNDGIIWETWMGWDYSLIRAEMKLKNR